MDANGPRFDYAPPRRRRRVPAIVWVAALTVAGGVAADQLYGRWETATYLDLNSGDVRHVTRLGRVTLRSSIQPTPFSLAVRQYVGPRPPPNWSFQGGRIGTAFECGGFRPSARLTDCRQVMQMLDMTRAGGAERAAVVRRCAAFLAADQGDPIEAESERLLDKADPP